MAAGVKRRHRRAAGSTYRETILSAVIELSPQNIELGGIFGPARLRRDGYCPHSARGIMKAYRRPVSEHSIFRSEKLHSPAGPAAARRDSLAMLGIARRSRNEGVSFCLLAAHHLSAIFVRTACWG